ncbi:MAG TPA: S9 family peptidase, partial [Pseudonocardia sp.]|nr:S9 family peptidase [Pseudonocardia sp.]
MNRTRCVTTGAAVTSAPHGSWSSPVDAGSVARATAVPEWLGFVGDEVWWTESQPAGGGRSALLRRGAGGAVTEALPGWDVRSEVMGYGGRPWSAVGDGIVFSTGTDGRVHRWCPGRDPVPLSPAPAGTVLRYADFAERGDEVWCLRETVFDAAGVQARRELVAVPLDGSAAEDPAAVRVLAASHDFVSGPRVAPDGDRVAWIGWNRPAMPWDATDLMVADVAAGGTLHRARRVGGGDRDAIVQVEWAPDRPGMLYAVSDADGWWNPVEIGVAGDRRTLCAREEEFGEAPWRTGLRSFVPLADGRLAVIHGTAERRLGLLTVEGDLRDVPGTGEYTDWSHPATDGTRVAVVAAGPSTGHTVLLVDVARGRVQVLREPPGDGRDYATVPYQRADVGPDGEVVRSYVHPPYNPRFVAPEAEAPPYLLFVHGGPTSRSRPVHSLEITYFTSRGIGVVDVQYGGSTGFGRAYRERLRGAWGIVDVR